MSDRTDGRVETERDADARTHLTLSEAARALRISRRQAYLLVATGKLGCEALGARTARIPMTEITRFRALLEPGRRAAREKRVAAKT